MYNFGLHEHINAILKEKKMDVAGKDNSFYTRMLANAGAVFELYLELYQHRSDSEQLFDRLIQTVIAAYETRSAALKQRDTDKLQKEHWFISNEITGMSLYIDRFCGDIKTMQTKLDYFEQLGVNFYT